jgi:5-methylcytosine-specific restriction endonuclease McrA
MVKMKPTQNHSSMRNMLPVFSTSQYTKKKIPTALRQQAWIKQFGVVEYKCPVTWCSNKLTPFSFDAGHNIPESKGGKTSIENLIPVCRSCNLGMGNRYTIEEWNAKYSENPRPIQPQDQQRLTEQRHEKRLQKAVRLLTSCFKIHPLPNA